MRRLALFGSLIALLSLAASGGSAQEPPDMRGLPHAEADAKEILAAALNGLAELKRLATRVDNWKRLGFHELTEVDSAELDTPFSDRYVTAKELSEHPAQEPLERLILPSAESAHVYFPVIVPSGSANAPRWQRVRSSIGVGLVKGVWKAFSYGSPGWAMTVAMARETAFNAPANLPAAFTVVRIPGLKVQLLKLPMDLGYRLLIVPREYELDEDGDTRAISAEALLPTLISRAKRTLTWKPGPG